MGYVAPSPPPKVHFPKKPSGPPMITVPKGRKYILPKPLHNLRTIGPHVHSPATGDMRVTKEGELSFYVYGEGWVSFKNPEEITAFTCLYCGSGWHDNRFHPGTCDNCGAPEDLGKNDANLS